MRLGSCVTGLVMIFAASVPGPARAEGEQAPVQAQDDHVRFTGTFRFGGDGAEQTARRAAIDKTVSSLFFAIRGIARSRLSDGTKIDPSVSFAFSQGKIKVKVPSSAEASSPEQGTATDYASGGDRVRLSQRLASGKLTQVFAADEGKRMNEWTLTPDGSTLLLKVTVSSSRLSTPCVYTLTYRRTS